MRWVDPLFMAVSPDPRRHRLIPVLFGGGGERQIFADTFTGTNGTLIADHVPDVDYMGNRWSNISGAWDIQSNRANPASLAGDGAQMSIGELAADFRATLALHVGQTTAASTFFTFVFRAVDANNYWQIAVGKFSGSSIFWLQEVVAGTATLRASGAYTYVQNTPVVLAVTASGATISASLNGGTPISYASAVNFMTVRTIKLGVYQPATITNKHTFDDFMVTI